ncbi:hypothetical protein CI109_101133 [Kwoniella shandongensis]|uniref:Uncharacterized protein n=1 Tax=Kwoniella shandongensis TaxID=1734106 RepID=A0A5M6C4X8_9TREE|nr:uncharacterized protein CI109_001603 [Kwoniella shandongensis]KAA5530196.1 hypothetical protein CI109_001603 [Kwoniella shandongensis]
MLESNAFEQTSSRPPPRPSGPTPILRSTEGEYSDSLADSSFTSTASTHSTTSFLLPETPYNTMFTPGADVESYGGGTTTSHGGGGMETIYEPMFGSDNEPAPLPRHSPESSLRQSFISSHGTPNLAPTRSNTTTATTSATSYKSDSALIYDSDGIPISNRPIPAPLLSLRSTTSSQQHSFSPSTHLSQITPTTELSQISSATPPKVTFGLDLEDPRGIQQEDVDAARLRQMGYNAVLGRDYTFWSSLSISWLNIGALQGTIYAVSGAYSYGGPLMILVAWPVSGILCFFLTLTLSEFASAYPVAGAMATWAWKIAKNGVGRERGWSWLITGFVIGGHVGNILLVTWEIVNIVAGTMTISFDYSKKPWQMFLFFLAVLLICGTVGSTHWGRSHYFWLGSGAFGFTMWAVLCITLLATNATKHNPGDLFTKFYNTTGWSSKPYVYILGWQFTTIASGADASAHMAEETQNPSRNVPKAMTASVVSTYVLGYISIVLLLLSVPPDEAVTVRSHAFPFGYILTKAISESGAIAICCLMIVVLHLQVLAQLQASSRFVFACAREQAMPFSDWVKQTNEKKNPVRATWLVVALCAPFALMTIGSQATLYSVLAVTASTMSYVGYAVPVALYLVSDIDLQLEGRTSWSLRKWSKPVAVVGLLYVAAVIITQMFPGSKPVTAATMSWSPVIIVGTASFCYLTWKLYGDTHFAGPIRAVTKWESGVEIDLSSTLAASRSRHSAPSDSPSDALGMGVGIGARSEDVRTGETKSSLKLALSPCVGVPETIAIVEAADASEVSVTDVSGEWTSSSETDSGEESDGSASTITRGTGTRTSGSVRRRASAGARP